MPEPLTKKQARVYEYIRNCVANKRYSPSIRDISRGLDYKEDTSTKNLVKILIKKGWVSRDKKSLLMLGRDY